MRTIEHRSGAGAELCDGQKRRGYAGGASIGAVRGLLTTQAVGLVVVVLTSAATGLGGESSEKRVETRDGPVVSAPAPSPSTPNRPGETSPPSKPPEKCEKDHGPPSESATTVEEQTTVVRQEVVVVESIRPLETVPDYLTFPEVLQDTLGRPRVHAVVACTDPRYPLPGYAFVGLRPEIAPRSAADRVRLRRLDFEVEAGTDWHPSHSVFVFAAGNALFRVALAREDRAEVVLANDTVGGRSFPLSAGLAKSGSLTGGTRYVVSFEFIDAASGKAPVLQPGDGVYLSIEPAPTAPPTYAMPRFLLVAGRGDEPPTLELLEKTGANTSVVPEFSRLELAAFCSVMHRLPR